jgi:hypothetical protein
MRFYYLSLALMLILNPAVLHSAPLTQSKDVQGKLQEMTLYNRIGHHEATYGKSAFNFKHGMRSDHEKWAKVTRNYPDLIYGSLSINRNSDWFHASAGSSSPNKIKDLGSLEWADVDQVPALPATLPSSSGITVRPNGESMEESSEQRVTRAIAGHIYLVHSKYEDNDYYAMFRVDALVPGDNCTITWKLIPSPEKEKKKR